MATLVELCNQALSEIGARSTISSLSDNSKEAQTLNIWVNPVRLQLLRAAHWGFARQQVLLTKLGELSAVPTTSPYPWQFVYDYPTGMVRLRYLLINPPEGDDPVVTGDSLFYSPWAMPSRNNRFIIANDPGLGDPATAGRVILSNTIDAIGVYTADISDTTFWDQGFEDAYVALLASKIVIALTGNVGMKATFEELARGSVIAARATDGNEALPSVNKVPDWIAARGDGMDASIFASGLGMWWQGWDTMAWGE